MFGFNKRQLAFLLRGPGFCSGDFSKNCESLNLHSMRTVKAAGFQWGWVGFMFYRAVKIVPEETRQEQIVREKLTHLKRLAWDQLWQLIVWVSAIGMVFFGGYYFWLDNFAHASYCELVAIFLILLSQVDWNTKHKIVVVVPGARAGDQLQLLHTAATDGYEAQPGPAQPGPGHCKLCTAPLECDGFCSNLNCEESGIEPFFPDFNELGGAQ